MNQFDMTTTLQLSLFALLAAFSATFFAISVGRRIKFELELRRRYAVTPRSRRVAQAAKAALPGFFAALLVVGAAETSPAQAQDLYNQQAYNQQAALQLDTDTVLFESNSDADVDLDPPFLFIEGTDLNHDPAEVTVLEQAHLESCYFSARGIDYAEGRSSDSFASAEKLSIVKDNVEAFYVKQRQRTQFDDCARQ